MATTRDRALAAAVRLVGEQGVRALTHARVDAEAGLPRGSTSNWFRTRTSLISGVIDWIAAQERAGLETVMATANSEVGVVDAVCGLLDDATGRHVVRTRARYALFLEVAGDPVAQRSLAAGRSTFEEWTRDVFARLGARDPGTAARTLLAVAAGLIVNRLTVAPGTPVRPAIELVVRGCLSG